MGILVDHYGSDIGKDEQDVGILVNPYGAEIGIVG